MSVTFYFSKSLHPNEYEGEKMKEYIEGEGCLKIIIHTMVEDDYEGEGTSKLLKISHFIKIKKLPVSFLELIFY